MEVSSQEVASSKSQVLDIVGSFVQYSEQKKQEASTNLEEIGQVTPFSLSFF